MIYLTDKDREALRLIDRLISTIDNQRLQELVEKEEIVSKLKGEFVHFEPLAVFKQLIETTSKLETEMMGLRSEVNVLKSDISTIFKAMNRPFDNAISYELQALKSRYGIY